MINFPPLYLKFLESIEGEECVDIFNEAGAGAYLYGRASLAERNETYEVALYEPDFYMIGQDGDLGFFIKLNSDDAILSKRSRRAGLGSDAPSGARYFCLYRKDKRGRRDIFVKFLRPKETNGTF